MAWAWKQDLKPSEKLILLALSDHSDDQGKCWPGLQGISKKCGLSRRAVISNLNNLINQGLVKKEHRYDDTGNNRSNVYYLSLEGSALNAPPGAADAPPLVHVLHKGSAEDAPPLVQQMHPESSLRTIKGNKGALSPEDQMKRFDQFWSAYPRKVAKDDAIKAFSKIKPDDQLMTTIMDALDRFVDSVDWQKEDGKFIPYPATWLRKKRWEDEDGIDRADPARKAI